MMIAVKATVTNTLLQIIISALFLVPEAATSGKIRHAFEINMNYLTYTIL